MSFETKAATLTDNLLKELPTPPNKYTFNSVKQYYRHFIQTDAFCLIYSTDIDIKKSYKAHTFLKLQV